jgi:hypothetical protein
VRLLLAFLMAGTALPIAVGLAARSRGVLFQRFPAWLLRDVHVGIAKRLVPYFGLWAAGAILFWLASQSFADTGGLPSGSVGQDALVGSATGLVVGTGFAILALVPKRVPSKAYNRKAVELRSGEPGGRQWRMQMRTSLLLLAGLWTVAFGFLGAALWLRLPAGLLAFVPPFVLATVGLVACGNPDVDDFGTARKAPAWLLAACALSLLLSGLVVAWKEPAFFPQIGFPASVVAYFSGAALAGIQMLHARDPRRGPKAARP